MLGAMGSVLAIEVSSISMREEILDRIVSFNDFSGKKLTMILGFRTGLPLGCRELADLRWMLWRVVLETLHRTFH
jgi:hypothetical protein